MSVADGGRAIMLHEIKGRYNMPKRLYTQKFKLLEKQEAANGDMLLKLIIEVLPKTFINDEGEEVEFQHQ